MTQQISVRAFGARPSDAGVALVDADFSIEAEAEREDSAPASGDADTQVDIETLVGHVGSVTLARHPDPMVGGWCRWGAVDHWLDASTVDLIRERRDREDVLEAIEAATALAAEEAGL